MRMLDNVPKLILGAPEKFMLPVDRKLPAAFTVRFPPTVTLLVNEPDDADTDLDTVILPPVMLPAEVILAYPKISPVTSSEVNVPTLVIFG